MWFIRIIFWLQAFVAPVILFALIGLWIGCLDGMIILLIAGAVTGIVLAEYIRRKIGLEIFFARIYGPNEMDEKIKKRD